jgi:hypothetical protein
MLAYFVTAVIYAHKIQKSMNSITQFMNNFHYCHSKIFYTLHASIVPAYFAVTVIYARKNIITLTVKNELQWTL